MIKHGVSEDYHLLATDSHFKAARGYWLERLERAGSGTRWMSKPGSGHSTARQCHREAFSNGAMEELERIAPDHLSRFTAATAALVWLAARYMNRERLVLLMPPTHLEHGPEPESPELLPMVFELREAREVRDLLLMVAKTVQDGYTHALFPVESLLRQELGMEMETLSNVVVYDDKLHRPPSGRRAADLIFRFDLERGAGFSLDFSLARFEPFFIEGFSQRLGRLEEILGRRDRELAHLVLAMPLPSPARVDDAAGGPAETVVHMFERRVRLRPERAALEFGGRTTSYARLDRCAGRLARFLVTQRGVGPESRIAVMMARSEWMVIALLGVLKAGAAFVPLDPELPAERLQWLVTDIGPTLLLIDSDDLLLASGLGIETFAPDVQLESLPAAQPVSAFTPLPENLAYILYTSGSSGLPKGCQITHGGLANYLRWAGRTYFSGNESGNGAFFTPLTFDFSLTSLFLPLIRGKTLSIHDPDESVDRIMDSLFWGEARADMLKLTPAHVDLIAARPAKPTRVQKVVLGGEALKPEQAARLRSLNPSLEIFNEYGPTEATIGCIVERVIGGEDTIAIGRPIAGVEALILDAQARLMPVGAVGEICLAGAGLARGYLGRPDSTAAAFVPHPFGHGSRTYRSGDLGRQLPDGRIECFGRIDRQIKLRGYRIEPAEIEAALQNHPSIERALVVFQAPESGNPHLCAYFTASLPLKLDEVRSRLRESLPEHMLPTQFLQLEGFPLTLRGKVDVNALLAAGRPPNRAEQQPPRNSMEVKIAHIWQEVLRTGPLGIHESFFDLGGHSLLATQAISRIWQELRTELTVADFFEAPTIAALSEVVATRKDGFCRNQEPICRVPRGKPIPLSFAQQRLWLVEQLEGPSPTYNITTLIRISGPVDPHALRRGLQQLVDRHEILRTRFVKSDGEPFQVIAPSMKLVPLLFDLSRLGEAARREGVEAILAAEAARPFNLETGPLIRVRMLRNQPQELLFCLSLHHIISDAWSMGILVQELTRCYRAFTNGMAPELPRLRVQYADFAVWQRQRLKGEVMEEQLLFWLKTLDSLPPPLTLPQDHPRDKGRQRRGKLAFFQLDPDLSEQLRNLGRGEGASLFMTLLSGFKIFLHAYSAQEDLVVGTSIANRNHRDTENLLGFFVNQLVLRTDGSGNPAFREFLHRVRATTLAAYRHQDLPFDTLLHRLRMAETPEEGEFLQLKFIFQNTPMEEWSLPGLEFHLEETKGEAAKFDFLLDMEDDGRHISGTVHYDNGLFEEETIAAMIGHLKQVFSKAAHDPDRRLEELARPVVEERRERDRHQQEHLRKLNLGKLKTVRRRAVAKPPEERA